MYRAFYLLCFYLLEDFANNLQVIKTDLIITDLGIDEITQLPITHYDLKEESRHLELKYHVGHVTHSNYPGSVVSLIFALNLWLII